MRDSLKSVRLNILKSNEKNIKINCFFPDYSSIVVID